MYSAAELCFLLCTISLIKATSIKIDGQLDLGENWNYAYRVYRTPEKNQLTQKDETAGQMEKFEELLRTAQERLQNVSSELRQDETKHDLRISRSDTSQSDKHNFFLGISKPTDVPFRMSLKLTEYNDSDSSPSNDESDSYTDSVYRSDLENETNQKNKKFHVVHKSSNSKKKDILRDNIRESQNEENSDEESSDSSDYTESVSGVDKSTLIVNKHKYTYRLSSKKYKDRSAKDSRPNILDYNIHKSVSKLREQGKTSFIKKTHNFNSEGLITTTIRTSFIYNATFMVKENQKMMDFLDYVFNITRIIFEKVKGKTNQDHTKRLIDKLERSYEAKFNEFHHETAKQKVKTRLGTQKVILNSIETSTNFANRLLNYLFSELKLTKQKHGTEKSIREMVKKAEKHELAHACKTFGICRSKALISEFLSSVLETIQSFDDVKFKQTVDAFTEELKEADSSALDPSTQHRLKYIIETYEKGNDVILAKTVLAILKNTIAYRNKPIIVNPTRSNIVNSTLALFEIIDLLDAKIDMNDATAKNWTTIKDSFADFGVGKVADVQPTVKSCLELIKENLKTLDEASWDILLKHITTALNLI